MIEETEKMNALLSRVFSLWLAHLLSDMSFVHHVTASNLTNAVRID